MNIYRIEHDITHEVHEGTARELGEIIGVTYSTVCKKALQYGKIAKHWKVQKVVEKREVATVANSIEKKLIESQDKCMNCGAIIPVGSKSGYFCNPKCGRVYRQRTYNAMLRDETKMRVGQKREKKKPKYSIAEISAKANAAGMTYGQYVSANGL